MHVIRVLLLVLSVLLVAVGVLWTAQGLGYLEGSSMTGERTWSIIGPVVGGIGVALGISVVQRGGRS